MDKTTAQRIVRDTFKAAFDRKRFRDFINELCNGFNESKAIASMGVPHAFSDHIKSCQRLGTFESSEGELADVLVVHLTESFKLERTRTALRDFVAHKLKRGEGEDNSYKEAALVAFVAPDLQSWRFSYVRMEYATRRDPKTGKIKPDERLTPARRYSYLVGTDEECHTAQSRFLALLQNTTTSPTLAQIEEAFSVESVTKEFFGEYARLFGDTEAALAAIVKSDQTLRDDFKAKGVSTVDFAKKLLGQIVFLYFIQKKGWLGVARGGKWGEGQRNFLRLLADRAISEKKCLFNDVLEPLFYDTLATDRGHEAWCKTFACRIPFLNGGLFEPLAGYDWVKTNISFTNALFTNQELSAAGDTGTGILDVFDRYNFTVNEAEPLEKEVAIDPEMLGKVFENLIEENRRKGLGAFYTPREIVHYMCQESLINYLDTALNHPTAPIGAAPPQPEIQPPLFVDSSEKPKAKAAQEAFTEVRYRVLVARQDLEEWIRQSDQFAHYAAAIAAGTKGSGYHKPPDAIRKFAREIDVLLRDITVCDPAIGSGAFPVGMMTEIVRARMALTPWFNDVAERTAYHFKRHAIHNSIYGVDIDPGAVEIAKLRLWLSLVVDEEDVQQIKPLPNLDYKIVTGNSLMCVEKTLFNKEQFKRIEELKPKFFDESDRQKKVDYKKQIEKLIHTLTNGLETFDFEIYFSEVFHAKGGFDVVIANPPYISFGLRGGQKMTKEDKGYLKQMFADSAEYKISMYAIFMELGIRLSSRTNGVSCFIVPDSFVLGMYFSKIRALILRECDIKQIVLLPFKVFKADVGFSVVYLFERNTHDHKTNALRSIITNSCDNLERRRLTEFTYPQEYFYRQRRSKFRLFFEQRTFDIVEKCRSGATALENVVGFSSGLIGLDGQDTITSDAKRGTKWLPGILSGGDILKFIVQPSGAHILYDKAHIKSGFECVDYAVPKLFMRQTGDTLICAYDASGLLCINNVHVGNIKSTKSNLKFICGLLNSKLLNFFYQAISLEVGRVMPQTDIETLDDLPIKHGSEVEAEIARLTDECIKCLKMGHKEVAKTQAEKIDRLVYKLYGLTAEEIAFVEDNVKL